MGTDPRPGSTSQHASERVGLARTRRDGLVASVTRARRPHCDPADSPFSPTEIHQSLIRSAVRDQHLPTYRNQSDFRTTEKLSCPSTPELGVAPTLPLAGSRSGFPRPFRPPRSLSFAARPRPPSAPPSVAWPLRPPRSPRASRSCRSQPWRPPRRPTRRPSRRRTTRRPRSVLRPSRLRTTPVRAHRCLRRSPATAGPALARPRRPRLGRRLGRRCPVPVASRWPVASSATPRSSSPVACSVARPSRPRPTRISRAVPTRAATPLTRAAATRATSSCSTCGRTRTAFRSSAPTRTS